MPPANKLFFTITTVTWKLAICTRKYLHTHRKRSIPECRETTISQCWGCMYRGEKGGKKGRKEEVKRERKRQEKRGKKIGYILVEVSDDKFS